MRPTPADVCLAPGAWARVALLLLCLSGTGCMSLLRGTARGYDLAPNGMTRADDGFRRALTVGSYASAFARAATPKAGAPDDALLRALYRGLTGYYAGEFDAAAAAFAGADALAERRLTKSVSRAAASVITNDAVLPYLPTRTEGLFLRYYAMHAHARAGRLEDAVVEARRLGRALEDVSASLAPGERPLHATLRDAAGAVFEAAGERNDALVSYRNAGLLRGVDRRDVDSIALREPGADSATLIVFVESGFVAHPVDRGLTIGLGGNRDTWRDSTASGPAVSGDSLATAASANPERIAEHAVRLLDALPGGGVFADDDVDHSVRHGGYRVNRPMRLGARASSFVRVAWPALRRASSPVGAMTLLLGGAGAGVSAWAHPLDAGADVTNALAEDFRRPRARAGTGSRAGSRQGGGRGSAAGAARRVGGHGGKSRGLGVRAGGHAVVASAAGRPSGGSSDVAGRNARAIVAGGHRCGGPDGDVAADSPRTW
jgi:hypothetical protein